MTDMTDKSLFIEENIINSLKKLLSGRVNELLEETEYPISSIEFGSYRGGSATDPLKTETGERFMGDRVTYRINGTEYRNIYGLTLSTKKRAEQKRNFGSI